jgi:hypothetical protein
MRVAQAEPPQPVSSTRRPRWRIVVAAVVVPVVLVAAGLIMYLTGAFDDDGTFRAEPPACATIAPLVNLLGVAYTTQQDDTNNCDLLLPRDHPDYIDAPKITVSYYVATPRRGDAPDAASEVLRQLRAAAQPLSGVGDEAYVRDRSVFLRVSNLVVGIVVFPREASTAEQVRTFAGALANRLREA